MGTSLLSPTEITNLTGIFEDVHTTFANNTIVVVKESIRIIIPQTTDDKHLFGFGPSQEQEAFTYSGISGVFSAKVLYGPIQDAPETPELNTFTFNSPIAIRVRRDARDFIENGKTLHILLDERTFLLDSSDNKKAFLNTQYYTYKLRETK